MQTQNFAIGIGIALLSLSGFIVSLIPALKPSQKHGFVENLKRASITSLGFLICFISGPIAIGYLASPTPKEYWNMKAMSGLFCVTLPYTLVLFIGSFIWYSGRDSIREPSQLD